MNALVPLRVPIKLARLGKFLSDAPPTLYISAGGGVFERVSENSVASVGRVFDPKTNQSLFHLSSGLRLVETNLMKVISQLPLEDSHYDEEKYLG